LRKEPEHLRKGEKGHGWRSGKNAIVGSARREERRRGRKPGKEKQEEKGEGEGKDVSFLLFPLSLGGHLKPKELIPKN